MSAGDTAPAEEGAPEIGRQHQEPRGIPDRPCVVGGGGRLSREQEKSLWLHLALLPVLLTDPEVVIVQARENLRRWGPMQRKDGVAAQFFATWSTILDAGLDGLLVVLTSTNEGACELRQNSPFAGVLDEAVRQQVLRSFREHWAREHADAAQSESPRV
jgi:hypothetical protein